MALISFHNCSLDAKIKMNLGIFIFLLIFSVDFCANFNLYACGVGLTLCGMHYCLVDCSPCIQMLRLWKWLMRLRRSQQQRSNFLKLLRVLVFGFII